MFNILFAVLQEKLILTEKEAQVLAEKISVSMLPSAYNEAVKVVKKILKDI